MKIEIREFRDMRHLLLITESQAESKILDAVFGKSVDAFGHIAHVQGEVRLSDGYQEHYIRLENK